MSLSLEEIRRLLWEDWDPIGVSEFSDWTDEYDSYAPGLQNLLRTGGTTDDVFRYLWTIETVSLGISPTPERRGRTMRLATELAERHSG